jgi:hypothetical protein
VARAGEDVQNSDYWRGRRVGLELAMMKLGDSGWKPGSSEVYPDELFVFGIDVFVNRKTGHISSLRTGPWDDHEELENGIDLIYEGAYEIVGLNPEEYVSDPPPRTVRLRQDFIPAVDTFAEPLMLSAVEVAASKFIYDDERKFVFLMLNDGQTVRVETADVELGPLE